MDYPDLGQYEDAFPETPFINNKQKGFKTQMKPKAAYASMVSEIDKNVGQIIRLLKEKGIWENTIFIFSSDNRSTLCRRLVPVFCKQDRIVDIKEIYMKRGTGTVYCELAEDDKRKEDCGTYYCILGFLADCYRACRS